MCAAHFDYIAEVATIPVVGHLAPLSTCRKSSHVCFEEIRSRHRRRLRHRSRGGHRARQAGYTVALLGRTEASLRDTQDAIRTAGGAAPVFPADVTDEASVDHAFARIAQQFGRLDVLFNNAGRNAPPVSLDEYEFDVWNSVVATNLTGVFLCARAAWRLMKTQTPQGGRIINNGSISAHAPRPDTIAYTATKHAVTGITKSLALDGRRYNIACGQIDIGNAATSLTDRMTQASRRPTAASRPRRAWTSRMSRTRSSRWRTCRSTRTS